MDFRPFKKLAETIIANAYLELGVREEREAAYNFLTGSSVDLWAACLKRDPIQIKRKAEYFYNNPDKIPLLPRRGSKKFIEK